jgi:hypothetical protein
METVRGAGQALLNDDDVHNEKEPGIYFDSEWLRLIFFILLMRLRQF